MSETTDPEHKSKQLLEPEVLTEPVDPDTKQAKPPVPTGVHASSAAELDDLGDPDDTGEGERPGRFARFSRRLWSGREFSDDAKLLVGAALETSDKVKTEAVKLVAREVRTYLEELKWKDDLKELLTSHDLEVKATFSLKAKEPKPAGPDGGSSKD